MWVETKISKLALYGKFQGYFTPKNKLIENFTSSSNMCFVMKSDNGKLFK